MRDGGFSADQIKEMLVSLNVNYKGAMVEGYYINPFVVPTAYAATIPLCFKGNDSGRVEPYLLVGKQSRRPQLTLPSGYMKPYAPEGKILQRDEELEEAKFQGEVVANFKDMALEDKEERDRSYIVNAAREFQEEVKGIPESRLALQYVGSLSDVEEFSEVIHDEEGRVNAFHRLGSFYVMMIPEDLVSGLEAGDDLAEIALIPLSNIRMAMQERPELGKSRCTMTLPHDFKHKFMVNDFELGNQGDVVDFHDHYGVMLLAAIHQITNGLLEIDPDAKKSINRIYPQIVGENIATCDRGGVNQDIKAFLSSAKIDISTVKTETKDAGVQTER